MGRKKKDTTIYDLSTWATNVPGKKDTRVIRFFAWILSKTSSRAGQGPRFD